MNTVVPGFPSYSFNRSGTLRRIIGGQGARPGIKKPHRHYRQTTFQLFRNGKPTFFSEAALRELVFGTDQTFTRYARGEEAHKAKLTTTEVLMIRKLAKEGWSSRQIAGALGDSVDSRTIRSVINRQSWRHV